MASSMFKTATPTIDSSLGLIMRLNNEWQKADDAHLSGKLDSWNFILDVIYNNLSYNSDVDIKKDSTGNIIDITFTSDYEKIYSFFNNKIIELKEDKVKAIRERNKQSVINLNNKIYHTIRAKDKWLRTYMMKLGLYLKQYENHFGNAMFGGK